MNKRSLVWRAGTVLVLVLIAAWMFVIGRGHTVYFDNKSIETGGETISCPYKIEVYVNDERVAKLYERERGMATWMGQNFKMRLEITQEKGGKTVAANDALPLPYNMDGIVLNLPAMLAGKPAEVYLSEFVSTAVEEPAEEEVVTDEFGITEMEDGGETAEP